jgi:S-formylglutathione hydrolase FrmB
MFTLAGSFSGALGAATFNEGSLRASLQAIFGAGDSETRKTNDIFKMVAEINGDRLKALPFIYLDCGTEDFLYQNNRDFLDLLVKQKVPHEYRELPGSHNWTFWDTQVGEFLRLAHERVK